MVASWGRAPCAERVPYTVWAPWAAWHLVRSSVRRGTLCGALCGVGTLCGALCGVGTLGGADVLMQWCASRQSARHYPALGGVRTNNGTQGEACFFVRKVLFLRFRSFTIKRFFYNGMWCSAHLRCSLWLNGDMH